MTALLTFTRFFCGCIYRTLDDQAVFCPQHRQEPHRAYATGTERVPIPSQDNFPIRGLVMSRYFKSHPAVLQNSSSNSLHTIVSTKDGRNEEWDTPEPELLGLCTACFIDHEQRDETRIAMCECGDEDCSYRWCCQGRRQNMPVGRSKSVPPERSLASVNVRAGCSGEVSQRQAGSRLGG